MFRLEAGPATVTIDPSDGCRLSSFAVEGVELLAHYSDSPTGHGCFPMAPYAGRVRDGRFTFAGVTHQLALNSAPNAIHGTVHDRPWAETDQPGEWIIDLGDRWPFAGEVRQRVHLDERRLRLELEVRATNRPMPATCGWHPWWRRRLGEHEPEGAWVDLHAETLLSRGSDGLPTGGRTSAPDVATAGPWDDCFCDVRWPGRVVWPSGPTLSISSSATYAVVFTEREPAVCLEPQSGPPDAFNLGGAVEVTPDRPLRIWAEMAWT